ncbi:uncharacterized protein TRUGW13939_08900 [Talaromyces rugulosus]|uniref:G domain-containing protein n=1 Tax=Talaromyces rugulosus TaxID=121627 RepID=A0A7H8R5T5_TALRU|nr:uncharacterized protein TRUGW13939_08900 [Talaromyces rugulosus]QKX61744.1 hypothetical protein TRUGW13939_08900 [Talaromyces rugulosus]
MSDTAQQDENDRVKKENGEIFRQLNESELRGKVKVIIIIGPAGSGKTNLVKLITNKDMKVGHDLKSGFGDPDLPAEEVEAIIYSTLGYFTRALGGVHGVLHVQSIFEPRSSQEIRDSIRFLDKIASKRKGDFEKLEMQMAKEEWKIFGIDSRDGSRSFRFGVDVEQDNDEDKEIAKKKIINSVFQRYRIKKPEELVMPFSEWSGGEQFVTIAMYTIGGMVVTGMGGILTLGVMFGEVAVDFSIKFLF